MNQATLLTSAMREVIGGKDDAVEMALVVLLAEGHLLIEDVPGVGKTVLARTLARVLGVESHRIQFTPDLLPSDVTGVSVFDQRRGEFEFRPGAVFAPIVIADEINRASPKTQSALLEAMEERQVTVDGATHRLPAPFLVVATQNPVEMEGTYVLAEAQRDRFMARISMGYPDADAELAMLRDRDVVDPLMSLRPRTDAARLSVMIEQARSTHLAPALDEYLLALVRATREHPEIRLGASPRASLQLRRAAKARAYVRQREYVVPEDISDLVPAVLAHRLLVRRGVDPIEVLRQIVLATPVPVRAATPR